MCTGLDADVLGTSSSSLRILPLESSFLPYPASGE